MSALFDELTRMTKLHAYAATGNEAFLKDMPPMPQMPCSVTADLRRHEKQTAENEREAASAHRLRVDNAKDLIADSDGLKKLLEDEQLAPPLSIVMANLAGAAYELEKLERELRIKSEDIVALRVLLLAGLQTERVLFNMAMERSA